MRIHFLGGLGDACLTRKYSVIKNELSDFFEIVSISDVYPYDKVRDSSKCSNLIDYVKKDRIKGKLSSDVESFIKDGLINGDINYFQLDSKEPVISEEFIKNVKEGDIVDISVPNKFHIRLAKQILEKTKAHIIIEKPLSHSLEEVLEFEEYLSENKAKFEGRVISDAEHYSHYGNVREFIRYFDKYSKEDGSGLGKITEMKLTIRENEGFSSVRNREIIEKEKAGGGIWLDTGIHAIAFLRNIGAEIDYGKGIDALSIKSDDPHIQDDKYAETAMDVRQMYIKGVNGKEDYFDKNCRVEIFVGKDASYKKEKSFCIEYENGRVKIDIVDKTLYVFSKDGVELEKKEFDRDAFYYVFTDIYDVISHGKEPFTSVEKAIFNMKDLYRIYALANPLRRCLEVQNV